MTNGIVNGNTDLESSFGEYNPLSSPALNPTILAIFFWEI